MRNREYEYRGKKYKSLNVLAKSVGIEARTIAYRLKKGMCLEDAINKEKHVSIQGRAKGIEITYKGKKYKSLKMLSEILGLNYMALMKRVSRGMSIEDSIEYGLNSTRVVVHKGKVYKSTKELADSFNIKQSTVYTRKRRGKSTDELVKEVKKITYKGVDYKNLKVLAEVHGLTLNMLRYRLRKGLSLEEAINLGVIRKRK